MADYMVGAATAWAQHRINRPSSVQHVRSQSSGAGSGNTSTQSKPQSPEHHRSSLGRATSVSALQTMSPVPRRHPDLRPFPSTVSPAALESHYNDDDQYLSTIPDPRSRPISPAQASTPSPEPPKELNDEVAALSKKLISAMNYQTTLDDTLTATRLELESSKERARKLQLENEAHASELARGVLVQAASVRDDLSRMKATAAEEKRLRQEADEARKGMELELENLTTALFEEANKMVITTRETAKIEQDAIQKKNDQLKAQLVDTETLLKSHQEQLTELKRVMEHMNADREDMTNPPTPSTPGMVNRFLHKEDLRNSRPTSSNSADSAGISYPTSFTHLIQPVLRTDLGAYDDFASLIRISKLYNPSSRASSGSYGGLSLGLNFGSYVGGGQSTHSPSNGSSVSNLSANPSPMTPTTPASTASNNSANAASLPLKETRFYKRVLAEDIDPTLRLDTAPGLSWLARRSVLTAMCDGTLVIEPMPAHQNAKYLSSFPCSLCGETRPEKEHIRTHRFRTSENESAQRYPICKYCLGRMRSTCDFLGFLRVLKDGHWRTDDEESEKAAWEESVRLREQMFWCRMGGGVIPVVASGEKSPTRTVDSDREREMMDSIAELARTGEIRPRDVTPTTDKFMASLHDKGLAQVKGPDSLGSPMDGKRASQLGISNGTSGKRDSLGSPIRSGQASQTIVTDDKQGESSRPNIETDDGSREAEKQILTETTTISDAELHSPTIRSPDSAKALSITIPGAFE